jgi:hypothetical protein
MTWWLKVSGCPASNWRLIAVRDRRGECEFGELTSNVWMLIE